MDAASSVNVIQSVLYEKLKSKGQNHRKNIQDSPPDPLSNSITWTILFFSLFERGKKEKRG